MKSLLLSVCVLFAGCSEAPIAPTPTVAPVAILSLEAADCQAPSDLRVGQVQGRTDIEWSPVEGVAVYNIWLQVEDHNAYVDVPGTPSTASGNRYETYLSDGIYGVRMRSVCFDAFGTVFGPWSDAVVFGGRSGPIVPPAPPVEPPVGPCDVRGHVEVPCR